MGMSIGKPKEIKAPKVPDPIATVETEVESADDAMKRQTRRGGFKRNVLAGQYSPSTGKKSVLG